MTLAKTVKTRNRNIAKIFANKNKSEALAWAKESLAEAIELLVLLAMAIDLLALIKNDSCLLEDGAKVKDAVAKLRTIKLE